MKFLRNIKYPILVLTIFLFAIVAISTRDFIGIFIVFVVLPIIILYQSIVRWLLIKRASLILRRSIMFIPALVLAVSIFYTTNDFGGRQKAALEIALAGQLPGNIHDLHIREDAWTDYVVWAYFKRSDKGQVIYTINLDTQFAIN